MERPAYKRQSGSKWWKPGRARTRWEGNHQHKPSTAELITDGEVARGHKQLCHWEKKSNFFVFVTKSQQVFFLRRNLSNLDLWSTANRHSVANVTKIGGRRSRDDDNISRKQTNKWTYWEGFRATNVFLRINSQSLQGLVFRENRIRQHLDSVALQWPATKWNPGVRETAKRENT